jgi:transposase InsO family protein
MKLSPEYPVTLICRVLSLPRSSYYHQPQPIREEALKAALQQTYADWPTYGYRRLTAQLQREGCLVGETRVRRLMREMNLAQSKQRKKQRTTHSQHAFPRYPNLVQGLTLISPDQVWVADITYVRLAREYVYLAILMDVFTRCIRGWHVARHLDQALTMTALKQALTRTVPEIHHSDQGVQYAATAYVDLLQRHNVRISMADIGAAWQNGYAERLIRTIKEEEVDLSEYRDYYDAYHQIGRFLDDVYMHKRIHSALGYLTPVEFEQQWLAQQALAHAMN